MYNAKDALERIGESSLDEALRKAGYTLTDSDRRLNALVRSIYGYVINSQDVFFSRTGDEHGFHHFQWVSASLALWRVHALVKFEASLLFADVEVIVSNTNTMYSGRLIEEILSPRLQQLFVVLGAELSAFEIASQAAKVRQKGSPMPLSPRDSRVLSIGQLLETKTQQECEILVQQLIEKTWQALLGGAIGQSIRPIVKNQRMSRANRGASNTMPLDKHFPWEAVS